MVTTVNKTVTAPDPSERFYPPSRAVKNALVVGATAGALAFGAVSLGMAATLGVASVMNPFLRLITVAGSAISGVVGMTAGATLGGAAGVLAKVRGSQKVTLSQVKQRVGVIGSDFETLEGMKAVVDIEFKNGAFQIHVKSDAERIRNLNNRLSDTEKSLSEDATKTSFARTNEDRFFDFEGKLLADSSDVVSSLTSLISAIKKEVKATNKYTFEKGNSRSSISRHKYMLDNILKFARNHGIAQNYLTSIVEERKEIAKFDSKLAEENFHKALQVGIRLRILNPNVDSKAPNVDSKAYDAMVKATASAATALDGNNNPDSVITSLFNQFLDAGLIPEAFRAQFVKDVREILTSLQPVALETSSEAPSPQEKEPGLLERASNLFEKIFRKAKMGEEQPGLEPFSQEMPESKKAKLEREAQEKADGDVGVYSSNLQSLEPAQRQLIALSQKLAQLLTEKSMPLDQIMDMGPMKLRGALVLGHREKRDVVLAGYEANDAAIQETQAEIARVKDVLTQARTKRPENFKFATKARRNDAETIEEQVKTLDAEVKKLEEKVTDLSAKIAKVARALEEAKDATNAYLRPPVEEKLLPEPQAPKVVESAQKVEEEKLLPEPQEPKGPSLLERLFRKTAKTVAPAPQDEVVAEQLLPDPVTA